MIENIKQTIMINKILYTFGFINKYLYYYRYLLFIPEKDGDISSL